MTNLVIFDGITLMDEPFEQLLEKAKEWPINRCLVVGYDAEGAVLVGGSFSDIPEIVLLLEAAKRFFIEDIKVNPND